MMAPFSGGIGTVLHQLPERQAVASIERNGNRWPGLPARFAPELMPADMRNRWHAAAARNRRLQVVSPSGAVPPFRGAGGDERRGISPKTRTKAKHPTPTPTRVRRAEPGRHPGRAPPDSVDKWPCCLANSETQEVPLSLVTAAVAARHPG